MKKYYIEYYRGFANTFNLYYCEGDMTPKRGWERITRKKAMDMISGYKDDEFACHHIFPADIRDDEFPEAEPRKFHLNGRIWERV